MKRLPVLLCFAVALLLTNCKKEEEEPTPDNSSADLASCQVFRIYDKDSTNYAYGIAIGSYKGRNKLLSISKYNGQTGLNDESIEYEYTNNDNVITKIVFYEIGVTQTQTGYCTYEYNAQSKLIKQSYFSVNDGVAQLEEVINYEYDPNGKIKKISEYNGANTLERYEMIDGYDTNGNLLEVTRFDAAGSLLNSVEYTYNDKFNPAFALGGFFDGFDIEASNRNALVKKVNKNAAGSVVSEINYTYEYNEKNYPTKATISYSDGSSTQEEFYQYNCD